MWTRDVFEVTCRIPHRRFVGLKPPSNGQAFCQCLEGVCVNTLRATSGMKLCCWEVCRFRWQGSEGLMEWLGVRTAGEELLVIPQLLQVQGCAKDRGESQC